MDDPIRITSTYPGPDGSVFTALDQTCGYCNRGPLRDPTVYLECVGYLHADCAMALGQLYEQLGEGLFHASIVAFDSPEFWAGLTLQRDERTPQAERADGA